MDSGKIIRLQREEMELTPQNLIIKEFYNEEGMVVASSQMLRIVEEAERIAPLNINVLITGESGVGKEELARWIHRKSGRLGQFIIINCAALPESLVESEFFGHKRGAFTNAVSEYKGKLLMANGGTLFLDEIGDMRYEIQAKFLQVLDQTNFNEERYFYPVGSEQKVISNFRIICASNQEIEKLVEEKKFRQDLFFRLNVVRFHIPPLRERREEIPIIAQAILQKIITRLGIKNIYFSPESLEFLSNLKWFGNVRELQNLIIRAVVSIEKGREVIEAEQLKKLIYENNNSLMKVERTLNEEKRIDIEKSFNINENFEEKTRKIIIEALDSCGWVLVKAAEKLGITRRRLAYQAKKLGIVHPFGKWGFGRKKFFYQEKKNEKLKILRSEPILSKKTRETSQEKENLIKLFKQCNWSQSAVARRLGVSRVAIYKKVRKMKINHPSGSWKVNQAWKIQSKIKIETEKEEKCSNQITQSSKNKPAVNQDKRLRFSKEELIQFLETHNWNKTKLAAALGIGYQKVNTLVKKLNIKPPDGFWRRNPKFTREKLETVLKENNWNQTKTARVLGISQPRVWALIKNRGIAAPDGVWERKKHKGRNYDRETLIKIFEENDWDQKKIANAIGVHYSTVRYYSKKHGIIPPGGSFKRKQSKKPTALEIILKEN